MNTYKLLPDTAFFDELNVFLIALSSVAIACELQATGKAQFNPGDYATIEAMHLDVRVRLPIVGPIAAALRDRKPDVIELTVVQGRDEERAYSHSTGGLKGLLNAVAQPFLVNYYERHLDDVRERHGLSDGDWPAAWQMAWVVRNGISHNGRVFFRSPHHAPVSWRGLTISPADNGTVVLGDMINVADLLVLMLDMEEARTGIPLPRA